GTRVNDAAVADQALVQGGPIEQRRRQIAHARIDDAFLTVKVEGRLVACEGQAGLVIRLDSADVLPVAVEQMSLDVVRADAARENLLAEILGWRRRPQQVEQR